MARIALRKPAVLRALGCSKSTLHEKINKGLVPKGTKLDPEGRTVIWWDDEIEEIQKRAVERANLEAAETVDEVT
jgi:predicted DNA-binding transcriptional regulator AlpA